MSAEKQLKSEEKSKTKEEVSCKTWKDELKKESEKVGNCWKSKKVMVHQVLWRGRKLPKNRSQK